MQVSVSTDGHVKGREELVDGTKSVIAATLGQFSDQVSRIEVHFSDEKADKGGRTDKRCVIEARPNHQQPVAVTHEAATVQDACVGAVKKLRSLLESSFGKLYDVKGAPSIRDNENR